MSGKRSQGFEAHLVSCDDCWSEVAQAREGRALGESLREVAPQSVRETIRASILSENAYSPGRAARRRFFGVAGLAGVIVAAAFVGLALRISLPSTHQPEPVAQAISDFRSGRIPAERASSRRAPDLSGMGFELAGAGAGEVGNLLVNGFSYRDPAGRRLQIYLSRRPFPEAAGARRSRSHPNSPWTASSGEIQLLCALHPTPLLALSPDSSVLADLASYLKVS